MHPVPPIGRTLLGGLLGTLALAAVLYGATPWLLGRPLDVAGALSAFFDTSWEAGMLIHLVEGTILLPALFAAAVHPWLGGPPWLRGAAFGAALWLGAELLLMPLVGRGPFHALAGGLPASLGSLAGHLIYGAVLGVVAGPGEVYGPQAAASVRAARRAREPARGVEGSRRPSPQRG